MRFFKKNKAKIKKCCDGVISVLLCIIMTPMITIAGMMVEFSRYQSTINLLNELMDSTVLSVLADYDTYLKDRFGVYAVSQESDMSAAYTSYFGDNSKLLGNAIATPDDPTVSGGMSLADQSVLQQQILDTAEMTDLVEFFLGDLQLDKLLEAFDSFGAIGEIADTANKMVEVADAIDGVVTAASTLKSSIQAVIDSVNAVQIAANTFVTSLSAFYTKLGTDGVSIDQNTPLASITSYGLSYLEDIKTIYTNYTALVGTVEAVPGTITDVMDAVDDLEVAIETAREKVNAAMGDSGESGGGDSDGGGDGGESQNLFDTVLDEFETAIGDTCDSIKNGTISTIQTTIDEMKNSIKDGFIEELNLKFIYDNISIITDDAGNTALDVTDEGLGYIKNLLLFLIGGDYTSFQSSLREILPNISSSTFSDLTDIVQQAIDAAEESLKSGVSDALEGGFKQLLAAIKGIFDMDVFYDSDLSAYISDAYDLQAGHDNPFQMILDAIQDAFQAAQDLIESVTELDIWGILTSIGDLFEAVIDAIDAIVTFVTDFIENVTTKIGMLTGTSDTSFYEQMLLGAYCIHNLPDRTCAALNEDGDFTLIGSGTTGFDFANIARDDVGKSFTERGLFAVLSALMTGSGSNSAFIGAELEYIYAGTRSEVVNQIIAFLSIYFIRFILDIAAVMGNAEVNSMAAAANVFSPLVYLLVLLGEPLLDTILIVNTARDTDCPVNLIKFGTGVYCTPTGVVQFGLDLGQVCVKNASVKSALDEELNGLKGVDTDSSQAFSKVPEGSVEYCIDYQAYMWLAMLFSLTPEKMMTRLSDLVYLEANKYYTDQGLTFDINKAYTVVDATCSIELESFLGLLGDASVLDTEFKRTRGY